MDNKNRYNNKQGYGQRNNNRPGYGQQNNNQDRPVYPNITKKLSLVLSDPVDLYLPDGKAYQYANDFKGIPSHQIRKVLNGTKEAVLAANAGDMKNAKKKMFILVAMTAYNAGRSNTKELRNLSAFVESYINDKSIQDREDVLAFDQFFTSIVAYHTKLKLKG